MSDSSEGRRMASDSWKPPVPKVRGSLRSDCSISPSQYPTLRDTSPSPNQSSESHSTNENNTDSDSEYLQEYNSVCSEPTSFTSVRTPLRKTRSAASSPSSSYIYQSSINKSMDQMDKSYQQRPRHSASIPWPTLLLGIILSVLAVGGLHIIQDHENVHLAAASKSQWSLEKIQEKFTHQTEELWLDIFTGIREAVLHPEKPTIIVLYGDEADTINCLANHLGKFSGIALGTNQHLILRPDYFKPDVGEVIHEFRGQISLIKAVVVEDLLNINSEAFKAFHNFCDRDNPLVGQAVYIITMITNTPPGMKNDLYAAEDILAKRFGKSIDKDILDPLITRVTGGVVHRVAKETLKDCNFS